MLKGMKSALGGAKDKLVSTGARAYANQKIAGFGEFTRLDIDSSARTVNARVMLLGEADPMDLRITGYSLYERDGKCFARMADCQCSKPWLSEIAKGLLLDAELRLPRKLYDVLTKLL